jgi:hypothetical protein
MQPFKPTVNALSLLIGPFSEALLRTLMCSSRLARLRTSSTTLVQVSSSA